MAGIWSGFLTFGLVTLPVRLYSGARGERVSFHLLHATDHVRLKQQMACPKDGEVVGRDQTVRGYEFAKAEYVVIPEAAIKQAAPSSARHLEIVGFCHAAEVDPVWFEASYYLLPEPAGRRSYALLEQAMRDASTVALAQLSMHNREYLSLIRPTELAGVPRDHAPSGRNGLLLHTLYYLDEMRVAEGFGAAVEHEPAEAELKLAGQLIAGLTQPFDPARFHDRYRANLEKVIEAALAGTAAPAQTKSRPPAPVVDLMESLKASLGQLPPRKTPGIASAAHTGHKTAKRRRAA